MADRVEVMDAYVFRDEEVGNNCAGDSTSHLIHIFKQILTTERDPAKIPSRFGKLFDAALSSRLERTLLQKGFRVWFSYLLARQEGLVHGLEQFDGPQLANVASQINAINPHSTFLQLESFVFQGKRGEENRKRLNSITRPTSTEPTPPKPFKRARIPADDTMTQSPDEPMVATETTIHDNQHLVASSQHDGPEHLTSAISNLILIEGTTIGWQVDFQTEIFWPLSNNLDAILPPNFVRQIFQSNGRAWLKASYPPNVAECKLEVFVHADATQHIIKELFDLRLECKNKRRGIRFDNGLFQTFNGSMELTGSPIEKVQKMLEYRTEYQTEDQAFLAFQNSPNRLKEISMGQNKITDCVILELWSEMAYPSRLTMWMEVQNFSKITDKLKI